MRVRAWATLLLLVGLTAAEFVVFVLVVQWIGPLWAVLAALVTSTVGMVLLRREGIRAWRRFRRAVDAGEPPGVRVADGLV
ncbi:MAG TPA: FxsA family protein, partial [Micromonosporaceae bacterium]|nr:FxsA family protein [Micromonosporaceae bacterium]